MKKTIILSLCLLLTGCQSVKEEGEMIKESLNKHNNGIYTTTVDGYGGSFDISMTYKDDKIVDVTIGENNETPSIGGVAAEQIAKNVVEQNTIELDVISGATVTSNAIYEGLRQMEKEANKENTQEDGNLVNGQSSESEGQPTK